MDFDYITKVGLVNTGALLRAIPQADLREIRFLPTQLDDKAVQRQTSKYWFPLDSCKVQKAHVHQSGGRNYTP